MEECKHLRGGEGRHGEMGNETSASGANQDAQGSSLSPIKNVVRVSSSASASSLPYSFSASPRTTSLREKVAQSLSGGGGLVGEGTAVCEAQRLRTLSVMLDILSSKTRLLSSPSLARLVSFSRCTNDEHQDDTYGKAHFEAGEALGAGRGSGGSSIERRNMEASSQPSTSPSISNEEELRRNRDRGIALQSEEVIRQVSRAVGQVESAVEALLRRALVAEKEAERERERTREREVEVEEKKREVREMMGRLREMHESAIVTGDSLKDMRRRLRGMEDEAERQKQRASDNEAEIARVREEFGVLKRDVEGLVRSQTEVRLVEARMKQMEVIAEGFLKRLEKLEKAKETWDVDMASLRKQKDSACQEVELKEVEIRALADEVRTLLKYRKQYQSLATGGDEEEGQEVAMKMVTLVGPSLVRRSSAV